MKVLFAGPSLYGADADCSGLALRPPAAQGDIFRATEAGATHIGLIDGVFGHAGAVWHKEILYALEKGIIVLGSSSMGALRAAECAPFGMIPIGKIANAYLHGVIDDDSAVALSMAPEELGFQPLTEPYIDFLATLSRLWKNRIIDEGEFWRVAASAADIHFTLRTVEAVAEHAYESDRDANRFVSAFRQHYFSQKGQDAILLVRTLKALPSSTSVTPRNWSLNSSAMWKSFSATDA